MRYVTYSILFFVFTSFLPLTAQMQTPASLRAMPDDTLKVLELFDYAMQLESQNLDSSAHYYQMAGKLSDKLNYYTGKIKYGMNYTIVLNQQTKLAESKELNQRTLALAVARNDSMNIAKAFNNLGNSFNMMANYDSAFFYYLKSVEIFEKIGQLQYMNIIYMNMAAVLNILGQYDKSIYYSKKSIDLSNDLKDSGRMAGAMNNMASSYASRGNFDSAIHIMNRSIPILQNTGDNYGLTASYTTLGDLYNKKKQYRKAIETFQKSLNIAERMNYKAGTAMALSSIAISHFYLNNYRIADQYADRALRLIEHDNTVDLLDLLKLSADLKARTGDPATAYNHMLRYSALSDSLTGIETKKHVAELQEKYMTAEKDRQLFQNELQLEESSNAIRQRNIWLGVFGGGAFLLVLLSVVYYQFNRQRIKLQQKELIALKQRQELERLKAEMEGQMKERKRIASEIHDDLGSGLTSILFMADDVARNHHDAPQKVAGISEAARTVMNNMNEIIWSMNEEYDSLEDLISYIRHNAAEFLTRFNVSYEFSVQGDLADKKVSGIHRRNIHLVVKEALHNIVKHAHATMVTIRINVGKGITIDISDNGKGMRDAELSQFGNGLKNMRSRMESIGGTFNIENGAGTTVRISVGAGEHDDV